MNLRRSKTGGRSKYLGLCSECGCSNSDRWYRHSENFSSARCRSCYGKHRLKNSDIRSKRNKQRSDWGIKYPYRQAKNLAKIKDVVFSLTEASYLRLISTDCYYCGGNLPTQGIKLDRVDSSLGYEENNCVACCWMCNVAKNDYSQEEFIKWAKRIASKF